MDKEKQKVAIEAIQDATRRFNMLNGPPGGRDAAEKDPLTEGLSRANKGDEDGKQNEAKADPALQGITRNLKFAEALAGEQRELDPGARAFLKRVLGPAVDKVQIYTGKYSDLAVRSLGAEAFAIERHVFFRSDKFDPGSSKGLGLLAHELTHTLQGKGGTREEKEQEARQVQGQAGELAEERQAPGELALDQAPISVGDVPALSSRSAATTAEKQGSLAEKAGKSVEEAQLFDVLKEELFSRVRSEIDMHYRIHGVYVR